MDERPLGMAVRSLEHGHQLLWAQKHTSRGGKGRGEHEELIASLTGARAAVRQLGDGDEEAAVVALGGGGV
jgi:hypothetical protein